MQCDLADEIDMNKWVVRQQHSKKKVDEAGNTLIASTDAHSDEMEQAYGIINNWRAVHAFPLNTIQMGLRYRAKQVDPEALVAQRIKRLSSIEHKLERLRWLKLSEMQDIGGCRAIVKNASAVMEIAEAFEHSHVKHKIVDRDDYIEQPKRSGYRGIHLIYSYYSDRQETYNGLKIEVQLRSRLQHAWATAVETVGTFTRQALKSSRGDNDWLRFFALMSTAMAIRERRNPVPDTPIDPRKLRQELSAVTKKLDVENTLHTFGTAIKTTLESPEAKQSHYFLLEVNPSAKRVKITPYRSDQLQKASQEYLATERALTGIGADAVLVSVESLKDLRRAYPNYFLDTHVFIRALKQAIGN